MQSRLTPFVSAADAATMSGLRLVVTRGVPGPWGEAAKGIFRVKRIEHVMVSQLAGAENPELVTWTGINSAPIAVLDDEPPRTGWHDILMLAERLQPNPTLIPIDERTRATMFGLAHELCAEDGLGWNRRLLFFAELNRLAPGTQDPDAAAGYLRMQRKYGHGRDETGARQRVVDILGLLGDALLRQQRRGSRYYLGTSLTAIDIYSACFMAMVKPLPLEQCPADPGIHAAYHERHPDVLQVVNPLLLEHRNYIYENYLGLPMQL